MFLFNVESLTWNEKGEFAEGPVGECHGHCFAPKHLGWRENRVEC